MESFYNKDSKTRFDKGGCNGGDGSIALVDYESDYEKQDKVKYLNYITGIANRYQQDKKECPIIHMVVIYTGDIERKQVSDKYNIGAVKMKLETAFLSELDSKEIFGRLREKVKNKQMLSDEELMEFIILPLSYHTKEEKQEKVKETVELAAKIQDRNQQIFTLAGILVFADKIIDKETAFRIRRVIEMTQVAQIFEEEKRQALIKAKEEFEEKQRQALTRAEEEFEEKQRQALTKAEEGFEEKQRQIVIRMIKREYSTEEIVSLVSSYSQDDVERLWEELLRKAN